MKKEAAPTSVFETLDRLKTYTEFETVRVGADGSVEVKYAVKAPTKKPEKKDKPTETAIDSLGKTPPPFKFGD